MQNQNRDSHRRTTVKALLWRFIGIFWTWGGAFVILLLLPRNLRRDPIVVATLITAWHHSTRMIMYYIYERIWDAISWGRGDTPPLSKKAKIIWTGATLLSISLIFWLLFTITPAIKNMQKRQIHSTQIQERKTE